ncbi:hypothetical protein AAGS39_09360 [Flavobacterium sp. CGRL2]
MQERNRNLNLYIMKISRILIAATIAGLAFVSCKKEEDKSLQVVNAEKKRSKRT